MNIYHTGKAYKEAQKAFYRQALRMIRSEGDCRLRALGNLSTAVSDARREFVDFLVQEPLDQQVELVKNFTMEPPRGIGGLKIDYAKLPVLERAFRKVDLDNGSMAVLARSMDPTNRGR